MATVPELPAGALAGGGAEFDGGVTGGTMDVEDDAGAVAGAAEAGGTEAVGRALTLEEMSGRGLATDPRTGR